MVHQDQYPQPGACRRDDARPAGAGSDRLQPLAGRAVPRRELPRGGRADRLSRRLARIRGGRGLAAHRGGGELGSRHQDAHFALLRGIVGGDRRVPAQRQPASGRAGSARESRSGALAAARRREGSGGVTLQPGRPAGDLGRPALRQRAAARAHDFRRPARQAAPGDGARRRPGESGGRHRAPGQRVAEPARSGGAPPVAPVGGGGRLRRESGPARSAVWRTRPRSASCS